MSPSDRVPIDSMTPALRSERLSKHYQLRGRQKGLVRAADEVSLSLWPGQVLAVVGESGSGKSTVSRMLSRLIRPSSGKVLLDGADMMSTSTRAYRSQVQLVFQDPFSSFNPGHRIRYHLERPLRNLRKVPRGAPLRTAVNELLRRVKLDEQYADKYPFELSGGQLQRVAIARALAANPRVLLADEPVSMLDVSIRLGILNLLGELRDHEDIAILYVTHDIASARYFADEIAVMYGGQVIEKGPSLSVADAPAHPYTRLLLAAAPDPERSEERAPLSAAVSGAASSNRVTSGCRFRSRCPFAMDVCSQDPPTVEIEAEHTAACWLYADGEAGGRQQPDQEGAQR
jgi:peptide/nickel transport system ATP-binding protein